MNKFELSSVFLIGHEKIDSDHVELVRILNEMVDDFNRGDVESCQKEWQLFCEKLQQHFVDEEKIMHDFGFVCAIHDHRKLLQHVQTMGKGCNTLTRWEGCLFETRNDLLSWILREDLHFAEHLVTIGYNNG